MAQEKFLIRFIPAELDELFFGGMCGLGKSGGEESRQSNGIEEAHGSVLKVLQAFCPIESGLSGGIFQGKAVEDYRSPRRFALGGGHWEIRQVLDCASPLAL
jgi:hypothetical protein